MEVAGLHRHGDEVLDVSSILSLVMFLIERLSDADDVRSRIRSSKDRFIVVMRSGFCFG